MNELNPMKKLENKLSLLEAKIDSLTSMVANPMNSEEVQRILGEQQSVLSEEQLASLTSRITDTINLRLGTLPLPANPLTPPAIEE